MSQLLLSSGLINLMNIHSPYLDIIIILSLHSTECNCVAAALQRANWRICGLDADNKSLFGEPTLLYWCQLKEWWSEYSSTSTVLWLSKFTVLSNVKKLP